jgi:hypothetical protein
MIMECNHAKFFITAAFRPVAIYFVSLIKILHPTSTLGCLVTAGVLGIELPHKQIFSLCSYLKNALRECLKEETFQAVLFIFVSGDISLNE